MNYVSYHNHTFFSLSDSSTSPQKYIDRAKELGMEAIAFTEHSNVFNWIQKKQACDKAGIKYIHGVELYMTEALLGEDGKKIRDNYHIILLAKNNAGLEEINALISLANDNDHFYYRPRITFAEFLDVSDNVITTSACIGGVMAKLDASHPRYRELGRKFTYIEIQAHVSERQQDHNMDMFNDYGDKLIAAADAHAVTQYDVDCRDILMKSKGVHFDEEDQFDLVMPTYQEFINRFEHQGCLEDYIYEAALERTNEMAAMCEDIKLNTEIKYPDLYDDADSMIEDLCAEGLEQLDLDDETFEVYAERIEEELRVLKKLRMNSFMIFSGEIGKFCRTNEIEFGYGRGSSAGSLVAYLLAITDVDPIKWNTSFPRFANEDRIGVPDIDSDFSPADRRKIYDFIISKFGDGAAYIATFQKLGTKSIIDMIGRYAKIDDEVIRTIKREFDTIDKEESKIKKDIEDGVMDADRGEALIEKRLKDFAEGILYPASDAFKYFDGLRGVVMSTGYHPAGMIGATMNLRKTIGLSYNKKKDIWISQVDMKGVDSVNYVKYDILSLKSLQVARDSFRLMGSKMPTSKDLNWQDQAVIDSLTKSPVGLFQFESSSAFRYLKDFAPKSVEELSLLSAILRPGCASFRDDMIERNFHNNASKEIDDLLSDTYGRLVYQEQQIAFLQQLCGFSGSQADTVRRIIGKKKLEDLDEWMPKIEAGYIANSSKPEAVAREEVKEFLTIFVDAASYSFNKSHSVAYAMMTYVNAYQRHHQPVEFVAAYLNNASDDSDIKAGTVLANVLGVQINNPKYGFSEGDYAIREGEVYKGIGSVLNVSSGAAQGLLEVYAQKPETFADMLELAMAKKDINKTKIVTLIKIDFFSDFGKAKKLDRFFGAYQKYKGKKTLKKENITAGLKRIVEFNLKQETYGFSETAKQYKFNDKALLQGIWDALPDNDFDEIDRIVHQMSFLNYIQDSNLKGRKIGMVDFVSAKGYVLVKLNEGVDEWYATPEGLDPIYAGDCIEIVSAATNPRNGRKTLASFNKVELLRRKR